MAKPIQITGIESQVFIEKRFCWKNTANNTVMSGDMEPEGGWGHQKKTDPKKHGTRPLVPGAFFGSPQNWVQKHRQTWVALPCATSQKGLNEYAMWDP